MTITVSPHARSGLFALVAASTLANMYYSQPILASLAGSLHTSPSRAALVVVATLAGNGAAQLLLVPLADLVERRRLAQILLGVQAAAMLVLAGCHQLPVAIAASVVVGLGGASAMVLLSYAASLVPLHERGRATGTVMSGVLLGILFSRSISGFVSGAFSWRVTFAAGAVLVAGSAAVLATFPASRADEPPSGYRRLLGSVLEIAARDRFVQRRMLVGVLGFVSFNVLWTGLTLLLSGPSYRFSDQAIGLFGIIGLVGALIAKNAGTWFDRGHGPLVSRLGWTATAVAWAVSAASGGGGRTGAACVILAVALLDAGMQAQHITNQSTLIAARPAQTARVTTAYMSSNVFAGAVGGALASVLYPSFGWDALAVLGLTCSVLALLLLRTDRRAAAVPR
ncbi:MFS transporter [Actinomadura rupiterrae]|uniref:MFS transporter n=1 Tax=Actinomadura rupiterrae TaxID=559627 RepID=UPI0020A48A01|nr:MFS transporter [Actinomadura rupiterrae]MCP2338723.1 putative MFS family arabinose efflux permease [Actinomadura rupiterrae]